MKEMIEIKESEDVIQEKRRRMLDEKYDDVTARYFFTEVELIDDKKKWLDESKVMLRISIDTIRVMQEEYLEFAKEIGNSLNIEKFVIEYIENPGMMGNFNNKKSQDKQRGVCLLLKVYTLPQSL